jgi:hypothetical protein
MIQGGSIRISPSWAPIVTIIDIRWDTDDFLSAAPKGDWWGDLALLAGTGTNEGEWEWDAPSLKLRLWVPNPAEPGFRRLIATLDQFAFPIITGMTGTGKLSVGLVPATEPPPFDWEGRSF